ncbi:MAG: hypothetical protein IPL46_34370 [Saprospiraceae bacterium]|nr:hypothetical protein [Saprospiraceae bacterium]
MKSYLLISVALLFSCTKVEILRDVPDCIESKIKEYAKTDSTCDTGAEVSEYEFQNKTVFTFFSGSCGADRGSVVYDDRCNFIGGLGGIGNIQEVNGENFANARFIAKIWGN